MAHDKVTTIKEVERDTVPTSIAEKIGLNERVFHVLFFAFSLLLGYFVSEYNNRDNISREVAEKIIQERVTQQLAIQNVSQVTLSNSLSEIKLEVSKLNDKVTVLNTAVVKMETKLESLK